MDDQCVAVVGQVELPLPQHGMEFLVPCVGLRVAQAVQSDVSDAQRGTIVEAVDVSRVDDDSPTATAKGKSPIEHRGHRHALILSLEAPHEVDVDDLRLRSGDDECQTVVGARKDAPATVLLKHINGVRRQSVGSSDLAHLACLQVVKVDAAAIGTHPHSVATGKQQCLDKGVEVVPGIVGRAETMGIFAVFLVDQVEPIACSHGHTAIGCAGDGLHLTNGIIVGRRGTDMHQRAVEASHPQVSVVIGVETIYVVVAQQAVGHRVSLRGRTLGRYGKHAVAVGSDQHPTPPVDAKR